MLVLADAVEGRALLWDDSGGRAAAVVEELGESLCYGGDVLLGDAEGGRCKTNLGDDYRLRMMLAGVSCALRVWTSRTVSHLRGVEVHEPMCVFHAVSGVRGEARVAVC